jgi:acetyl esterase/lipase
VKTIFLYFLVAFGFSVSAQLPYTQEIYSYDSLTDVVYGTAVDYAGNTDTLLLDIYKPAGDANCLRPAIVLIHGGAFVGGSKSDADLVYLSRRLAARGWVVANINYRLGNHKTSNYTMYALCNPNISAPCAYVSDSSEVLRASFRAMQDAKGAVRFMKERHAIDSTDTGNFFLAGESAGGFTALAAAFTDRPSEKPADCFVLPDAPAPDPDFASYGCTPFPLSLARPDLGSVDGTIHLGNYDARVKGVGNFFGGVFNLDLFTQQADTPVVYLFHQGSDVIVHYGQGPVLGRISWECFAQTNLCQSYYFYPEAYGSEGIRQYFDSLGTAAPSHVSEIVYNYDYLNNCFSNGHAIDNIQLRLQHMTDFFAPAIAATGNDPLINCLNLPAESAGERKLVMVYPNPAEDILNVVIDAGVTGSDYSIVDQLGRVVRSGSLPSFRNRIDIGSLRAGLYYIKLKSGVRGPRFIKWRD